MKERKTHRFDFIDLEEFLQFQLIELKTIPIIILICIEILPCHPLFHLLCLINLDLDPEMTNVHHLHRPSIGLLILVRI